LLPAAFSNVFSPASETFLLLFFLVQSDSFATMILFRLSQATRLIAGSLNEKKKSFKVISFE